MRRRYRSLNEGSETRGCKERWRKMSSSNRSNQTYHQLQVNSQKAKPNRHPDPSNPAQAQAHPRGEPRPPGICNRRRPTGSIVHLWQAGRQRKANVRGRGTAPGAGRAAGRRFGAFLPDSPRTELFQMNRPPPERAEERYALLRHICPCD